MRLSSRQIRIVGLGALVLLIALISIQGIVTTISIEKKVDSLIADHQADLEKVDNLLAEFVGIRGLLTAFVINEQTDIKPLILKLNSLIEKSGEQASSFREERHRKGMEEFTGKVKEYKAAMFAYSQELLLGRTGEGIQSWERTLMETENTAHSIVSDIKESLRLEIGELGASILRQGKAARTVNIVFGFFGIFAGLYVAVLLQRALASPIQKLVSVTSAVASGDLAAEAGEPSRDEIGVLTGGIASMIASLRDLVRGLLSTAQDIGISSEQLSRFSDEVSRGASKQSEEIDNVSSSVTEMNAIVKELTAKVSALSGTLEESSSSTQEITASIREVSASGDRMFQEVDQIISSLTQITAGMSETVTFLEQLSTTSQQAASGATQLTESITKAGEQAQESKSFAEEVSRQAKEHGGAAVEKMIAVSKKNTVLAEEYTTVIEALGERSTSIGDILDVIQDVADQTNLLALNAAIIAAQAGEHGRGFAVVAEEIRKLSATTTENVKQIGSVIEGMQDGIREAVGLIGRIRTGMDSSASSAFEAGEVLQEIERLSFGSSRKAGDISSAVAEQIKACQSILDLATMNLNEVIRIRRAADEQKSGSRTIVASVEEIRSMAERIKKSTEEQASGSEMIADTISRTHDFAEEINAAMRAEQEASQSIVASLLDISQVAEGNLTTVADLDKTVKNFGALASRLALAMDRFRLPEGEDEDRDGAAA